MVESQRAVTSLFTHQTKLYDGVRWGLGILPQFPVEFHVGSERVRVGGGVVGWEDQSSGHVRMDTMATEEEEEGEEEDQETLRPHGGVRWDGVRH